MNETPIVRGDYICLEPVEVKQILVDEERGHLEAYGKVIAIGPKVVDTKIGDIVGFEEWDIKFFNYNGKKYLFIHEWEYVCQIPVSAILSSSV